MTIRRITVPAAFALALLGGWVVAPPGEAIPAAPSSSASSQDPTERPLRSLMVALGQDMSRVHDGIWREDYAMVRLGAEGIATHPKITAEERATIQTTLGARFAQFVAFDGQVHGKAEALAEAAAAEDLVRIRALKAEIETGCVGCHTTFRTEVRNALTARTP